MNKLLILFTGVFISFACWSQCDTNRYVEPIFNTVFKHSNVKYGEGQVWNIPYNNTDLFMDIYEPIGDVHQKRPLMIWIHPGGFLLGDKEADDMVALCDSFARKGYVTASLGYRLGFNPLSASSAVRAVYRGTQDTRAAIRYLKEFADIYGIDTNYTFVGGSSAGGFAALHTAYLTDAEAPSEIQGGFGSPNLGCLDCSGNNYSHNMDLTGIINMWGALGDSNYVEANETVPALLIHGEADATVPNGVGNPFGAPTTPIVNGSRTISNQLTSLGIAHTYRSFPGLDHEFHGADNGTFNNPPNNYWDTIHDLIQDHVYPLVKPNGSLISGFDLVCEGDTRWYYPSNSNNLLNCWEVTGGTIVYDYNDSIEILWDTPGNASIGLRQYNSLLAASDKTVQNINILPIPDATFSYTTNGSIVEFTAQTLTNLDYFWDFGDGNTGQGATVNHTYSNPGNYVVTLTVSQGGVFINCMDSTSQTLDIDALGITNLSANGFSVFPNPVQDLVHIETENQMQLAIYNLQGKLMLTDALLIGHNEIDLSNLKSGLYMRRFERENYLLNYKLLKN